MSLVIGVIGGSGLYELEGLQDVHEVAVDTPFGKPSDKFVMGKLGGVQLVFIPRHGRGHRFNPSEVNYRANIFGLKKLGVSWIIAISAVGSLQEEIVPGHMVVIDSFIDRTTKRSNTFYEKGIVAHVQFGEALCPTLRRYLVEACNEVGATVHDGGTYVNMEGPAFSTVAESNMHRDFGAKVIGMTNMTEARLAREAEISFATVAMATDYDCWREGHDAVTVEDVIKVAKANVGIAKSIIKAAVPKIAAHTGPAPAEGCLAGAIMTDPKCIPEQMIRELQPLIGKYVSAPVAKPKKSPYFIWAAALGLSALVAIKIIS